MKKQQQGIKPIKKDSFERLLNKWYEKNTERDFTSLKTQKSEENQDERVKINEVRLMSPEARLDLHGFTSSEAYIEAASFLKEQYYLGKKKVEIVTGKGLHSPDGRAVVRDSVMDAIRDADFIRESYFPRERYGGSGTIHIIFKTMR